MFFRMYLMKRNLSRQHQLLIDLENQQPNSVYYATPGLRSNRSFNAAYISAEVHLRSVLFSPSDIGLSLLLIPSGAETQVFWAQPATGFTGCPDEAR